MTLVRLEIDISDDVAHEIAELADIHKKTAAEIVGDVLRRHLAPTPQDQEDVMVAASETT